MSESIGVFDGVIQLRSRLTVSNLVFAHVKD